MSKQVGGNQVNPDRVKHDMYPTDPLWVEALLRVVDIKGPVWECAAGNRDISKVFRSRGCEVRSTDIQDLTPIDFLEIPTVTVLGLDRDVAIVTNPPYNMLSEFINHALELTTGTVAMLANINALGGLNRTRDIWKKNPPSDVIIVADRMKLNGKDSQFHHVWVVWQTRNNTYTKLHWQNARGV